MEVFWYHNFVLYIYYTKNQVYFFISQNRFCDIKNRFGYIQFDFVMSQNGVFIVNTGLSFRTLSITTFNCQKPMA